MFRSLLFAAFRTRRHSVAHSFLPASVLLEPPDALSVLPSQRRRFGGKKKGPGKRSKYALRRKDEIQGYKQSPFGLQGRPVKHFDELKFYHARNKYGQKETLIDGRRRDIAFFDPVAGGFERDPRSSYRDSGSDGELRDEEAALYADFTDTDDDDLYFGGGRDEDGDYDDAGRELRPKERSTAAKWADDDPPLVDPDAETDIDEEEREFNEVFGRHPRKNSSARGQKERSTKRGAREVRESKEASGAATVDPEIGIDAETFRRRFQKAPVGASSPVERGFSPDAFLKEDEASSDGAEDSEWDEERMVRAGEEEMEELTDVSDMIRDYERSDHGTPMEEVTEEMAENAKQREMQSGEFYASDDVEVPYAEDPELQREIAEEHEENVKKLKSTPGGRKMFKEINRDAAWLEDFPPTDKRLYENALGDAAIESPQKLRSEDEDEVRFVERDEKLAAAAPSKRRDAWRTLSVQFDEEARDADFLSDLRK